MARKLTELLPGKSSTEMEDVWTGIRGFVLTLSCADLFMKRLNNAGLALIVLGRIVVFSTTLTVCSLF